MASYRVEVSATADKQIRKLLDPDRLRVLRAIAALAHVPRPPGCRKLTGLQDVWRIRAGFFRIIYSVEDRILVIIVLKVGHRKDVYR